MFYCFDFAIAITAAISDSSLDSSSLVIVAESFSLVNLWRITVIIFTTKAMKKEMIIVMIIVTNDNDIASLIIFPFI